MECLLAFSRSRSSVVVVAAVSSGWDCGRDCGGAILSNIHFGSPKQANQITLSSAACGIWQNGCEMAITKLDGQLEIDHDRGVIYFHIGNSVQSAERCVVTALRVCSLPTPIPEIHKGRSLDITYMYGCDWEP